MPSRRQAVLTISGPEDQTITYLADFDRLTLTLTQEGGYRRNPEGAKAIAPATADAYKEIDRSFTQSIRMEGEELIINVKRLHR